MSESKKDAPAKGKVQRGSVAVPNDSGVEVSDSGLRGMVSKRGTSGLRKYQARYFVLRKGFLMFFRSKEDYEGGAPPSQGISILPAKYKTEKVGERQFKMTPKPEVTDGSETMLVADEEDYLFSDAKVEKPHKPKPGRVWEFQCDKAAARDVWVERLQTAPPVAASAGRRMSMSAKGADMAKMLWKQ